MHSLTQTYYDARPQNYADRDRNRLGSTTIHVAIYFEELMVKRATDLGCYAQGNEPIYRRSYDITFILIVQDYLL